MNIQCPQCQAKYRISESQFAGHPRLQIRCTKCKTVFSVEAPKSAAPVGAEATRVSKAHGPRLPEGKNVALSVTQGPKKGQTYPVIRPRVVLGRAGTDIVVDDPEVSRKHCAIEFDGAVALLVDLGSTNGCFVNGERVETHELQHLSEFRIGGTTLMLTVTDKQ